MSVSLPIIKEFRRYIAADALSVIGDNLFFIMLLWLGQEVSGNAAITGVLLTVHILPRILLKLYGGKIADLHAPQRIVAVCLVAQALVLILACGWLQLGGAALPILFAIAGLFGTINAFLLPATLSIAPRIISHRRLGRLNQTIEISGYAAQFVGIAVAGILLIFGAVATMLCLAGVYLVAASMFIGVRLVEAEPIAIKRSIKTTLRYVWRQPVLRGSGLLVLLTSVAVKGPINIGLLLVVTAQLGYGSVAFSSIYLLYSIGGLVMGVLLGSRQQRYPGRLLLLEFLCMGVLFGVVAMFASLWVVGGCFLLLGGLSVMSTIAGRTWQQQQTDPQMYGSVASVMGLSEIALEPLSRSFTGVLALWSLPGMFIIAGVYLIVVVVGTATTNPILLRRV